MLLLNVTVIVSISLDFNYLKILDNLLTLRIIISGVVLNFLAYTGSASEKKGSELQLRHLDESEAGDSLELSMGADL
jgi:hypothetical protein